jgi:hypothetical protein
MHFLTYTPWVESGFTRDNGQGKTYRSCQKHESLSLHDVVSFITSLKSNPCTALTTQITTENSCITSHAQNGTSLQPSVFPTGIYRLVVTRRVEKQQLHLQHPLILVSSNLDIAITRISRCWNYFSPSTLLHSHFLLILSSHFNLLVCGVGQTYRSTTKQTCHHFYWDGSCWFFLSWLESRSGTRPILRGSSITLTDTPNR